MWYYMDGCTKKYRCASGIYLISCLALEFSIIIDRAVGAPGHVKDVVSGLNARDKFMRKLSMENLFNPGFIRGEQNN